MTVGADVTIDTANPEQAAAWNGHEGAHWAEHADRFETIGDTIWQRVLDRKLVAPHDRVLDIGCGTGKSTRDLGRLASAGRAVGIDLSAPMLAIARERAAADGLTNVTFVQADAQIHRFEPDVFDVVVSSFGAMFFADPLAAFANIARDMRGGASLALLAWRELDRNEWISAIRGALAMGRVLPVPPPDAPTPFSLADESRVRSILTAAGFDDVALEPVDDLLAFGTDARDAYGFLRTMGIVEWLTHDLDESTRTQAFERLRSTVEAHEDSRAVRFGSSSWLITATKT